MPARRLASVRTVVGLDFVVFGIVFPLLPLLARHLGLDPLEIGLLLATYSVMQIFTAPLWGRVADRRGRRPVLLVALSGSALSAIGVALAPDLLVLSVAVLLNGASGGSMAVAQAAVADLVDRPDQAREFGRLGAYVALGFVVGPALASASALGGIRAPFALAAALGVANVAYAFARFPETLDVRLGADGTTDTEQGHLPAPGRMVRSQCAIALVLSVIGFGAFEATYALLGRDERGLGPIGISLSFMAVGLVLATTEGAAISLVLRRLGGVRAVVVGAGLFSAGFALVGFGGQLPLLATGLVLLGAGYGLLSPILTALWLQVSPRRHRARSLGWQQSVTGGGRVLGPALGGGLYAVLGPRWAYVALAGVVLMAGTSLWNIGLRSALGAIARSPRFTRSK